MIERKQSQQVDLLLELMTVKYTSSWCWGQVVSPVMLCHIKGENDAEIRPFSFWEKTAHT